MMKIALMKTPIAFLHTSPAAIPPLMKYYTAEAPDIEITNQLDDGLLRLFAQGDEARAESRLRDMLIAAREVYGARVAMITCSAVTRTVMQNLLPSANIPLFKIDDPMADAAVRAGRRLGVAVTFAPTLATTTALLERAAAQAQTTVELQPLVVQGAYDALLSGQPELHDELLLKGADQLAAMGVDAIVLAQVSMARILPALEGRVNVPVFSSLPLSLQRVREILNSTHQAAAETGTRSA
jgi:Asp/Glu/hydantoin racemase